MHHIIIKEIVSIQHVIGVYNNVTHELCRFWNVNFISILYILVICIPIIW
jgi:hypothetical protein